MKVIFLGLNILFLYLSGYSQIQYQSNQMTLLGHWTNSNIDSITDFGNQRYSGCYGWTDTLKDKRYAIVGGTDGTYFVEITQPGMPVLRDFVPGALDSCTWREYKTYAHYAYLGSDDSEDNRFQIVDLSYLPDSVHLVYDSDSLFRRVHTLYIDGDKLYGGGITYADTSSAMSVYSLAQPESPVLIRRLEQDYPWIEYVHDMFVRNDTIYASAGFQGLFIFTLRGDSQFVLIGQYTLYPDQGYNHSSYLTEDGKYLVFTDEVPDGLPFKLIDVSDMSNISLQYRENTSPGATPHNPYIRNQILYMASYQDGVHMYDLSQVNTPDKIGYFDTYWQNDNTGGFNDPVYAGCWGAWPFPEDQLVIALDMQNGLFILDASPALSHQAQVNESNQAWLKFQNPGQGDLTLHLTDPAIEAVHLLDLEGKELYSNKVESDHFKIPSTLFKSSGLYILIARKQDQIQSFRYLHHP